MPIIVLPPSSFTGLYQLFVVSSLVSVWWDGERQLPLLKVEHPEGVSIVYNGYIITNYESAISLVYRADFTNELIVPYDFKMHFTMPDVTDFMTLYYHLDTSGTSLVIDRLILNGTTMVDCSFHVVGLSNERNSLICKYNIST